MLLNEKTFQFSRGNGALLVRCFSRFNFFIQISNFRTY
jgi:hypothetical protein